MYYYEGSKADSERLWTMVQDYVKGGNDIENKHVAALYAYLLSPTNMLYPAKLNKHTGEMMAKTPVQGRERSSRLACGISFWIWRYVNNLTPWENPKASKENLKFITTGDAFWYFSVPHEDTSKCPVSPCVKNCNSGEEPVTKNLSLGLNLQ